MTVCTVPSASDVDRWEALLIDGAEPSMAARELGFTSSAFRRASPTRHAECLATSREARAGVVDERMELWALADDAPPAILLAWARRWNPAYSNRVALTGAGGGAVSVSVEDARDKLARRISEVAGPVAAGGGSSKSE